METFNPDQFFRLTALSVFAVAAIDLGMAFLMRIVRETSPDPHD